MLRLLLIIFSSVLLGVEVSPTEIVEEISRRQVGSVIIIIELVYYLVMLIHYVWVYFHDEKGNLVRRREKRTRKVWRKKLRRRIEQASAN